MWSFGLYLRSRADRGLLPAELPCSPELLSLRFPAPKGLGLLCSVAKAPFESIAAAWDVRDFGAGLGYWSFRLPAGVGHLLPAKLMDGLRLRLLRFELRLGEV